MRRLVAPLLVVAALAGSLGARAALPLAALGLVGCPPKPGETAGTGSGSTSATPSAAPAVVLSDCDFADLSGVEVGQRWVYELDGGALELVLSVRQKSRGEVAFAEYTTRVVEGGDPEPVGHQRILEWTWYPTRPGERPAAGYALEPHPVATPGGPRELKGTVVTQPSGDQVLSCVIDGRPAFPGELRVTRGGRVIRRLVRIE